MSRNKTNVADKPEPSIMYLISEYDGKTCLIVPTCIESEKEFFTFDTDAPVPEGELPRQTTFLATGFSLFGELLYLTEYFIENGLTGNEDVKIALIQIRKKDIEIALALAKKPMPGKRRMASIIANYCMSMFYSIAEGEGETGRGDWEVASVLMFPVLSSGETGAIMTGDKDLVNSIVPTGLRKLINESPAISIAESHSFIPTDALEKVEPEKLTAWLQYNSFKDIMVDGVSDVLEEGNSDYSTILSKKEADKISKLFQDKPKGDVFRHFVYSFSIKFSFGSLLSQDDLYAFAALYTHLQTEYAKRLFQKQANRYFPHTVSVYESALPVN